METNSTKTSVYDEIADLYIEEESNQEIEEKIYEENRYWNRKRFACSGVKGYHFKKKT